MKNSIEVFSLCEKKHADLWKINSRLIIKYVPAKFYRLIVPAKQINLFKKITPKKIQIISEEKFISKKNKKLLKDKVYQNKKMDRYNWILMNLLKLEAFYKTRGNIVLLWDSDSFPLKKINFFKNEKFLYYTSDEKELSYHKINKKILGYEPCNFSFITQCLIAKKTWISNLKRFVEKKYKKNWISVVIENLDMKQNNPFSEQEFIGNFIFNNYRNDVEINYNNWCRFGYNLIDHPKKLIKKRKSLSKHFDFIGFELWEKKSILKKIYLKTNIFINEIKLLLNFNKKILNREI